MRLAGLVLAALLAACSAGKAAQPDLEMILAGAPAETLSAYGLFEDAGATMPAKGVVAYDLVNPLFSDHAAKHRFVFVPGGKAAQYDAGDVFDFPVGSVLIKTFAFAPDMRQPEAGAYKLETRLLVRKQSGWVAYPYVWNEEGTQAFYTPVGARRTVETIRPDGARLRISYSVPNQNQCKTCHQAGDALSPLGPKARNLGHKGQLDAWAAAGILEGVPAARPLAPSVYDLSQPLEVRARAWLDINCAHCHKPDGSASNSGLVLSATKTDPVKIGIAKRPVAAGRGAGDLSHIIVPGSPDRSILAFRMASIEPGIAMPELGRSVHDPEGLALIREWIAQMEVPE